MLRWVLALLLPVLTTSCGITMNELFTCAFKGRCINKFQLHRALQKPQSSSRPYLLAVEGHQYKKLFMDCDSNKDGCIDIVDIQSAGPKCERECIWKNTIKDLLC